MGRAAWCLRSFAVLDLRHANMYSPPTPLYFVSKSYSIVEIPEKHSAKCGALELTSPRKTVASKTRDFWQI